jgi:hypothetical protein
LQPELGRRSAQFVKVAGAAIILTRPAGVFFRRTRRVGEIGRTEDYPRHPGQIYTTRGT